MTRTKGAGDKGRRKVSPPLKGKWERLEFRCPVCHSVRPYNVEPTPDGTASAMRKDVYDALHNDEPPDVVVRRKSFGGYGGIQNLGEWGYESDDPEVRELLGALRDKIEKARGRLGGTS
jgi:hypothetical protein